MGNSAYDFNRVMQENLGRLFSAAESSGVIPDICIDVSLLKYAGLDSAAELENSIKDMTSRIPDFVQSLGSALSAFNTVPNAVGLGAVALAIALELIISTRKESKDNTVDMLRRVFAEEKASGVRDSIEEYMKRLQMNLLQPNRVLEETERLEKQLSEQLTRLKNSMLYDKQMSSRSLKHWTNGAAFHLQMLIHAARLKMQSSPEDDAQLQLHITSIVIVLKHYQSDLEELVKEYKAYKRSTISILPPEPLIRRHYAPEPKVIRDEELKKESCRVHRLNFIITSDKYVDYMFDNWTQLQQLKSYFSDLEQSMKDLIMHNNEFNMQKVLPVSNNQDA